AGPQAVVPLGHEVQRGGYHQGVPADSVHAELSHVALAGPGGEHHHAPTTARSPGIQGFGLKEARGATDLQSLGELAIATSVVLVGDLLAYQSQDDGGVSVSRGAEAFRARIPFAEIGQGPWHG